jgi:hypothetical protein
MSDFARPVDIKEGGRVTYGADDGLLVEFYIKPVLMDALSKDRGYPTFEDRIHTRIVAPGNNKTTWDYETKGVMYLYTDGSADEPPVVSGYEIDESAPIEHCDPLRFPKAWARFEKKHEKIDSGWAIEEWGVVTRSFAETLKALNIPTVEALAGLTDAAASNFMGGLKFRNLARAALDEKENTRQLSAAQEQAEKDSEMRKHLEDKINALSAEVASLKSEKRGRAA